MGLVSAYISTYGWDKGKEEGQAPGGGGVVGWKGRTRELFSFFPG